MMQFRVFQIPSASPGQADELNAWLRSHRILGVERHFCPDNGGYWTFCVEYADAPTSAESAPVYRGKKKDAAEDLTEAERKRFFEYKEIRKKLADQHAVPAYTIFTDRELVALSQTSPLTSESVGRIKGVAPSRLGSYVRFFFDNVEVENENGEEGRLSDAADL